MWEGSVGGKCGRVCEENWEGVRGKCGRVCVG